MNRYWLAVAMGAALMPSTGLTQDLTLGMTMKGGDSMAAGAGTSVVKMDDGRRRAGNGKSVKLCTAGQIAIAATVPAEIRTLGDETRYPQGLVACFDPVQFGGAASADLSTGTLRMQPAPAEAAPQPSSAPSL